MGCFAICKDRHVAQKYFISSKEEVEHFMVAQKLKDDEDRDRKLLPKRI